MIAEKNDRPGESRRNRYKSLALHDPVWYDHAPYLKVPPNWPVVTPKDKLGDWTKIFIRIMALNYWIRTTCKSATYDDLAREPTVVVDRDGEERTLKPAHLVRATGMSGKSQSAHGSGLFMKYLRRSRPYSQFLSLHLEARMEGIDTPVHGVPETDHLG